MLVTLSASAFGVHGASRVSGAWDDSSGLGNRYIIEDYAGLVRVPENLAVSAHGVLGTPVSFVAGAWGGSSGLGSRELY